MKKLLLSLSLFLSSFFLINAQDYENAVGLRAGFANGITFKHFFSSTDAAEGILSFRWRGFNITGLYERHQPAFQTEGLYFFYGAGAHIGSYYRHPWKNEPDQVTVLGIDGIIGLEYIFKEIPFNISLDWKPALHIIGYSGLWGDEFAFSLRYMF